MPADMQMRLIKLYLLPASLVMVILILLFGPWELFKRDGDRIILKDTEEVDRIILMDSYNTVELSKSKDVWYLFGREEVTSLSMENLLFTASRLEVASITGLEVFEESRDSPQDIREVSFLKGNKVLLSYRLRMLSGRYLINPAGNDRAFYVSLPGYPELDLNRVFSATPDHYREHLLIDLRPSDISSIEIDLASGEAFQFSQDAEGHIRCMPGNENTRLPDTAPNELAIKLLFSYFTSIRYEQGAGISADSLLQNESLVSQMSTVKVSSFNGEQHIMQVFPFKENPDSEPHLFKALVLYNHEQNALFVNYIYLDVLMRGLSHYFGEK